MDTQIDNIQKLVAEILDEFSNLFLVNIKVKQTNNIKIYIDGDTGITIENCVNINRKLYKKIEERGFYSEGDFSLEVSSPGIDEPLKLYRQYKKNIGRHLEIIFLDDSKKEGVLYEATETDIMLEVTEGKGKKAVSQQILVPLQNVKKATVQIKF